MENLLLIYLTNNWKTSKSLLKTKMPNSLPPCPWIKNGQTMNSSLGRLGKLSTKKVRKLPLEKLMAWLSKDQAFLIIINNLWLLMGILKTPPFQKSTRKSSLIGLQNATQLNRTWYQWLQDFHVVIKFPSVLHLGVSLVEHMTKFVWLEYLNLI